MNANQGMVLFADSRGDIARDVPHVVCEALDVRCQDRDQLPARGQAPWPPAEPLAHLFGVLRAGEVDEGEAKIGGPVRVPGQRNEIPSVHKCQVLNLFGEIMRRVLPRDASEHERSDGPSSVLRRVCGAACNGRGLGALQDVGNDRHKEVALEEPTLAAVFDVHEARKRAEVPLERLECVVPVDDLELLHPTRGRANTSGTPLSAQASRVLDG
mmetsp:Transcript_85348/g.275450  ORF Transcript_85348/g.275450 Transcript_85348/m.275450 type:complete len:213 (-) Transcript_85348:193-831(-)